MRLIDVSMAVANAITGVVWVRYYYLIPTSLHTLFVPVKAAEIETFHPPKAGAEVTVEP